MTNPNPGRIRAVLNLSRAPWGKADDGTIFPASLQVSISQIDENGVGFGRRLVGPKLAGVSTSLAEVELDEDDVTEIRRILDAAFPKPAAPLLPDTAYVVTPCRGPDPVGGVYLTEREATRAAYAIAGYGSYVDDVIASGRMVRAWTSGDVLAATIRVVPLHAPSHGLPVVGEAAVTAALDGDFAGDDGLPIGCGGGIGPVLDEAESARAAQDGGAA